jgi:hypothetical protein
MKTAPVEWRAVQRTDPEHPTYYRCQNGGDPKSQASRTRASICGAPTTKINRAKIGAKWADIFQCQQSPKHRFAVTTMPSGERKCSDISVERPVFGHG